MIILLKHTLSLYKYMYTWSKPGNRVDPSPRIVSRALLCVKYNNRRVKIIITLYVKHENKINIKQHTRMHITYYHRQRGCQTLQHHIITTKLPLSTKYTE